MSGDMKKLCRRNFLLLAHVYFTDQKNIDQKYKKIVSSHNMTIYFSDNFTLGCYEAANGAVPQK